MTSIEIPYSIAAALPSLAVLDITNEVARDVADASFGDFWVRSDRRNRSIRGPRVLV